VKPKPSSCTGCPAQPWGLSYVRPKGPRSAALAFIGQGPGKREAYTGIPFVGPSGTMLDGWCRNAGVDPRQCYFDNIVRCWLPNHKNPVPTGNRSPTVAEVQFCWLRHGRPALVAVNPTLAFAVGVPSASTLLGRKATAGMAGNVFEVTL
jgi:DNA polymerase